MLKVIEVVSIGFLRFFIMVVSPPFFFHIEIEESRYMPFPKTQQANKPAFSPYYPFYAERQARKLSMPFLKSVVRLSKEPKLRSTDSKAEGLTIIFPSQEGFCFVFTAIFIFHS